MKAYLKIISCLLLVIMVNFRVQCQPSGGHKLHGNLNDIDSSQLKKCIESGGLCTIGIIKIDTTSDLSRIIHLSVLTEVTLSLEIERIPSELRFFKFNHLKRLTIYGNNCLRDIRGLGFLEGLETLTIINFGGEEIKIDTNLLKNLKSVTLTNCHDLCHIDDLIKIISIENLWINSCANLKILSHDQNKLPHIKFLCIYNSPQIVPSNLCAFSGLWKLVLDGLSFQSIPDCLADTMEILHIYNNDSLSKIDNIQRLKNLKEFRLTNNKLIEDR